MISENTVIFFQFLEGHWLFSRRINGLDMMKGKASFLPFTKDTYEYREEGDYIPPSLHHISFFQEYYLCVNGRHTGSSYGGSREKTPSIARVKFF